MRGEKNMKNLIACSFAFVLLFTSVTSAQARGVGVKRPSSEQQIALVIGNAAYENAPLKNPVNDAQDMAKALRELGFGVIYGENLTQNEMKRAIQNFGEKTRNGSVGLFYYAGHGVQVKGVNYLVPVDAKIKSEEEVQYECVDAGFVLAQMENAGNSTNIVILDACRNNPFERVFRSESRGLASIDAPSGTLIAYATKPGSVASDGKGQNGVYTAALLQQMRSKGLRVEEMFKLVRAAVRKQTDGRQVTWESSSLEGEFCFGGCSSVPPESSTVKPEELLEIIKSQQQSEVKESFSELRGQNFSDEDLKEFKEKNVPKLATERLKHDSHFIDVVLAIKRMELISRQKLFITSLQTYKKTWGELKRISREGQTEAGQEAERLIAKAIVDLVKELYNLPAAKLNELRK
jgi:hypothetical protein